jgi:zinc protease
VRTVPNVLCSAAAVSAFVFLLGAVVSLRAQDTPPAPEPPRPVAIPKPSETKLRNGLRVIVLQKADIPLVTIQMMIMSGGEVDPPDRTGVADITAELLTKGTANRTAPQIAQEVESLGGGLESSASWDASNVHINVMATKLVPAMEILADVIRRPAFRQEEIDRTRRQLLDDLKVAFQEPGTLASYVATRVVFGSGPYGHPLPGTPESLARIRRADIVALHQTYYRPDNAVLVVAGQCSREEVLRNAERLFGDWTKPAATLPERTAAEARLADAGPRCVVVDMRGAGQAAVVVAKPALKRTDPRFFEAIVANSVLGGGYSARLNQEIRIKRGLSYGAGSTVDARRQTGPFVTAVQTKNESAAEVVALILSELRRLQSEPVPAAELQPRKAVLIGNFGRALQTTDGLVARLAGLALYGLSLDEINHYIPGVEGVTAGNIAEFARSVLDPAHSSVIVVGDAAVFGDSIRKQFPNAEVIPLSRLSLSSPTLKKAASQTGKKAP